MSCCLMRKATHLPIIIPPVWAGNTWRNGQEDVLRLVDFGHKIRVGDSSVDLSTKMVLTEPQECDTVQDENA